jgi:hypothetical protein
MGVKYDQVVAAWLTPAASQPAPLAVVARRYTSRRTRAQLTQHRPSRRPDCYYAKMSIVPARDPNVSAGAVATLVILVSDARGRTYLDGSTKAWAADRKVCPPTLRNQLHEPVARRYISLRHSGRRHVVRVYMYARAMPSNLAKVILHQIDDAATRFPSDGVLRFLNGISKWGWNKPRSRNEKPAKLQDTAENDQGGQCNSARSTEMQLSEENLIHSVDNAAMLRYAKRLNRHTQHRRVLPAERESEMARASGRLRPPADASEA